MKSETITTVITGQKICHWVGIIVIAVAVILFIFDWNNGNIEWDNTITGTVFGMMCLYVSQLLRVKNGK